MCTGGRDTTWYTVWADTLTCRGNWHLDKNCCPVLHCEAWIMPGWVDPGIWGSPDNFLDIISGLKIDTHFGSLLIEIEYVRSSGRSIWLLGAGNSWQLPCLTSSVMAISSSAISTWPHLASLYIDINSTASLTIFELCIILANYLGRRWCPGQLPITIMYVLTAYCISTNYRGLIYLDH